MYYIGVDLGGTNIAVGLVEKDGRLLLKKSVKTNSEKGFDFIMRTIAETILSMLQENDILLDEVEGIGIGSPGCIDSRNGVVIYSNNIKMENSPMAKTLHCYLDKPVFISNDANCAALGESVAGAAKGLSDVVLITLGTGIGSGVILNNRIFDGSNGTAPELGHTAIKVGGEKCSCGRKGCWETYASATSLIRQIKDEILHHPDSIMSKAAEIDGKIAFDAAKQGDLVGETVVKKYLTYVAEGIVNAVNIFRPEVVLIGGGISHAGDYILEPIQRHVNEQSFGCKHVKPPRIKLASLGNDAGIIGAAMLCKG